MHGWRPVGINQVPPMWRLIVAIVAMALLAPAVHAQQHAAPPPAPSEKQKAAEAEKRARDKDIDEAYKATLKQMPDKQEKADPWGNLRAPGGK
jgi:uncharacterized protein YecT (DUF1311 family)